MSRAQESVQEPRNITPGQKRGRDEETSAGIGPGERWPGWPGESVFRLLITSQEVDRIIGRKGEFVKKMCEETKSRIKILDGVPGIPDRVIMISAKEEPVSAISPAMDGVLRVHKRKIEGQWGPISTRMLLPGAQSGSLIGKQGSTINSIKQASGARVQVLGPEDVPLCALPEDKVVEIQGQAATVHKAVEQIVSHLRKFLVDHTVLPLYESNKSMAKPLQMEQHIPQQPWSHRHNNTLYGRDPALSSHSSANPQPAHVITQQMQMPLTYVDVVIGTDGSNITYCRAESRAIITVRETTGVPDEITVEIHGTITQVQKAHQLIQNFINGFNSRQ